jgi:hypothetical protein
MKKPFNRQLLEQAAASLDTVATNLDTIQCTLDGRIATLDAGEDWQDYPHLPATQMRRLSAPSGAPYTMLEVKSQAGAYAHCVQLSHAADLHVLSGQLQIGREHAPEPEYYATGSCAQFHVLEPHSFQVLQDCHNLLIIHTPSFLQNNEKQ